MGDTFELETIFSLRFPDERAKPVAGLTRESKPDDSWSFRKGGEEVVAFKASSFQVPEELRAIYERWLVYRSRIHPQIRAEICGAGRVPAILRTRWRSTGETEATTLDLQGAEIIKGNPHRPAADFAVLPVAEGELREVVLASRDCKRRAECPTLESATQYADKAISAGRPLDGALALFEIQFQSRDDIIPAFRSRQARFHGDEECMRFFSSMDQSDKAASERALRMLRAIARKGLTKDYILDVHIGDHLSSLGQRQEAEAAFLTALRRNPFLAGVWKDLGQLYYRSYEMPKAWLCWDTARSVSPGHPMLKEVTQLEERLESDFPEFFMRD